MTNVNAVTEHLDELAEACRILAAEGHEDMTLGHLSWRDPEGRGIWLKRSGIGLGEVEGPDDFVLIDFAGERLAGAGNVHKEWPIHAEIMRARPEVASVGHTHPIHACAFSAIDQEIKAVTHEGVYFGGPVPRYGDTTGLIDTVPLGRDLAAALGEAPAVLLRNHGVAFVGESIGIAVLMGIFLEKACRVQLLVRSSGAPFTATPDAEIAAKREQIFSPALAEGFWAYYRRKARAG
jgi:L-fuculose-phosphate aldolase